jgi:hypothetical protein
MKSILSSINFLVIIFTNVFGQFPETRIASYDIKVNYDTVGKQLDVTATIAINRIDQKKEMMNLLFTKLSKISKINFVENKIEYPISYNFLGDTIIMSMPKKLQNCKNVLLYVEYKLPTDSHTNNKIFLVVRAMKWCPLQYDVISTLKIQIETPVNYEAFSSGDLIENTSDSKNSYYTWENNVNTGIPLLIAPKNYYSITRKTVSGKELNFHFLSKDTLLNQKIINEICNSFQFYSNTFGEYKHQQLNLFENPDSGDYAVSIETFVWAGDLEIKNTNQGNYGKWMSHETAHQWFGGGYFNASKVNNRLHRFIEESLTEFVRYMYIENVYGKDSLNKQIIHDKDRFEKEILNTEIDVPISDNMLNKLPYIKGPLIFLYVRKQIGNDNWISFLKTLYQKYYGTFINYDIFKAELSKYDKSGKIIKRMEEFTNMKGILPDD